MVIALTTFTCCGTIPTTNSTPNTFTTPLANVHLNDEDPVTSVTVNVFEKESVLTVWVINVHGVLKLNFRAVIKNANKAFKDSLLIIPKYIVKRLLLGKGCSRCFFLCFEGKM